MKNLNRCDVIQETFTNSLLVYYDGGGYENLPASAKTLFDVLQKLADLVCECGRKALLNDVDVLSRVVTAEKLKDVTAEELESRLSRNVTNLAQCVVQAIEEKRWGLAFGFSFALTLFVEDLWKVAFHHLLKIGRDHQEGKETMNGKDA